MSEMKKIDQPVQTPRRAFFGHLLAAVGGGLLGGSLVQKLLSRGSRTSPDERPITVSIHPLAVPRSKEGSTPNV